MEPVLDSSFLGARAGRYKPVSLLGRGSFGTCVLVRRSEAASGSNSGLRVVKTVGFSDEGCLQDDAASKYSEALREAEVLKLLRHPNIIGYEDAFVANDHLCIVMEYADGGDLAAAIARRHDGMRRYHEREAMAIFSQLALALRHVHGRRIMHRDVKSQNVFLTSGGAVKLGDFGVAKVLEATELCAATRIGTPQCAPPELCENQTYDFKADVWGLGVIFYQLLALECPFNGPSFAALAVRICTAEPRPVPSMYSADSKTLVSRLLAKRPEDRPSSAELLAMPHVRRSVAALPGQNSPARSVTRVATIDTGVIDSARGAAKPAPPASPLRVIRRRVTNALRRAATMPETTNPELASRARKSPVAAKKAGSASPLIAQGGRPRKLLGDIAPQDEAGMESPKKAPRVVHSLASLVPAAEDATAAESGRSPDSRGSVSDIIAFFLESPARKNAGASPKKSSRSSCSDGAVTASTRAATGDSYARSSAAFHESCGAEEAEGISESKAAEDAITCSALLSALELEFGLA